MFFQQKTQMFFFRIASLATISRTTSVINFQCIPELQEIQENEVKFNMRAFID